MTICSDNWEAKVTPTLAEQFLGGAIHRWNTTATQVIDDTSALWACPRSPLSKTNLLVQCLHRVLLVSAVCSHEEHLKSLGFRRGICAGCRRLVHCILIFTRRCWHIITIDGTFTWPHNTFFFTAFEFHFTDWFIAIITAETTLSQRAWFALALFPSYFGLLRSFKCLLRVFFAYITTL